MATYYCDTIEYSKAKSGSAPLLLVLVEALYSIPMQVTDEYGNEAYRGALDATLYDPNGKDLKSLVNVQDDDIEVEATGVKVRRRTCIKYLISGEDAATCSCGTKRRIVSVDQSCATLVSVAV